MKQLSILCLLLAGCQAPAPILPSPRAKPVPEPRAIAVKPPTPVAPPPAAAPSTTALEERVKQQAQAIEALIGQNDALTAMLPAPPPTATAPGASAAPAQSQPPTSSPTIATPVTPTSAPIATEPFLTPNAEGLIDLAAANAAVTSGEPVNPFTVRSLPPDAAHEVSLRVSGVLVGEITCAVINERVVQSGDSIESFAVERIDSDAVCLRRGDQRMRLSVSDKNVRVRLPL